MPTHELNHPDALRIERLTSLLSQAEYDALVCRLPHNVLMLSGYFPVLAQSIAVFLPDGHGTIIVPESELFFAKDGWFRDIRTFVPTTLDYVLSPTNVATPILAEVCCENGISFGVIGIERKAASVPATYLEVYSPRGADHEKWAEVMPGARFQDATELLREAAMVKSRLEIEGVILANKAAHLGFEAAREMIQPGVREVEVAEAAKMAIETKATGMANVRRVQAWAFCMSGERTVAAYMPYQYSTNRRLLPGDSVIIHINCCVDGFWTDVARTFFVGRPTEDMETPYRAILDAWQQAFRHIRPGIRAAEIDGIVRSVLSGHGYGEYFTHGTGHGVGFKAIDPEERPVIHPQSDDILETGMVFTIEPAVYMPDAQGMRISDVVCVRGNECKVLSDIPRDLEWAKCPGDA
ncbi:MAG: Xaa-Pro peptidase family protein [Armatimonadetes bacterium]|nr:Xaa-Pro peptidase family protein [Armatimonadota bacterium]